MERSKGPGWYAVFDGVQFVAIKKLEVAPTDGQAIGPFDDFDGAYNGALDKNRIDRAVASQSRENIIRAKKERN